jgi:hypothetical protein
VPAGFVSLFLTLDVLIFLAAPNCFIASFAFAAV